MRGRLTRATQSRGWSRGVAGNARNRIGHLGEAVPHIMGEGRDASERGGAGRHIARRVIGQAGGAIQGIGRTELAARGHHR